MNKVDFLFELGTEELPPVALSTLASAFSENISKNISEQGLTFKELKSFATPRRLAVLITSLDTAQPDSEQTRLGPAVVAAFDNSGNPTKAAEGFARSCNLNVAELEQIETDKGLRLGIKTVIKGKVTDDLLPNIISKSLQSLPIPKGMRWGNGTETFIRPVKWIAALVGQKVLPLNIYNCTSSNISHGHRFMSSGDITIKSPKDYESVLEQNFVIADQSRRKQIICEQVNNIADSNDLNAVINETLLDEVSALVEWPVALMGSFEESFLSVPKEALISTMAKNQKYFHLLTKTGELANSFITIANIESTKPESIIEGNERVIRPRLADAKFFYESDSKQSLTQLSSRLEKIVFQSKLGSIADKCSRLAYVASQLTSSLNADLDKITIAANICKADLVTEMVGEFPNLQGIMGKYYAQLEGLDNEVALALEEIYLPKSANDDLPKSKTGICLALADRIDTLVGIFGIQQLPTGNKDPYALRRAALGIIRIINEHSLDLDLASLIDASLTSYESIKLDPNTKSQLLEFFSSRNKALYLDKGFTAQEISSVESLTITKPLDFHKRIKAVKAFAEMKEAESLAAANKRVANILTKNASNEKLSINPKLFTDVAETALYETYMGIHDKVVNSCDQAEYINALEKLVGFAEPLEAFFDQVMVMVDDQSLKTNRIALLKAVRELFLSVADISALQK